MYKSTLSVILSNYNYAHYIDEVITSILNQSYKPLEIIILDDASTDNSIEVIEQFARQEPIIRFIRNKKNMGIVHSYNKLIHIARGEYLYMASADNSVLPGLFDKCMRILEQYPQAGLCCADAISMDIDTGIVRKHLKRLSSAPIYFSIGDLVKIMQKSYMYITGTPSIYRRSAFIEAGTHLPGLKWHGDWFACLVIALRHGICYIPEPLVKYRVSSSSYSSSSHRDRQVSRQSLEAILYTLKSPAYKDILPLVKQSCVLSWNFHLQMLTVMLSRRKYWEFISFKLFRRILWYDFRLAMGRIAPSWIKPFYRFIRNKLLGTANMRTIIR